MSMHTRDELPLDSEEETKAWDLKDEFKYAPKKPEGDPWKILLDPLMEREKKRCDAWNTEIQNLLIFAGLFSGLVTAFIIESYKTLQPDPNADIVSLLAHIATRLDNSTNLIAFQTTSVLSRPSQSFVASAAAVRVNIFWFISLILSLTVILSGIIAMQWLREHQAYTGQSSKDMIAILHMRVESLEKWHVKDIITTFPLILAVALVLFFAGIIDFLHVLGNRKLLVAVSTLITISLILLVASTILPASQCTFLYIWLGHQDPPSPCPYKSPQSGFFHAVCYYISSFLSRRRWKYIVSLGNWLRNLTQLNSANKHALLYLTDTWSKKTWAEVDLCWLSVREACLFPEGLDGYYDFLDRNGISPLFDITKTFHSVFDGVSLPQNILSAVYHCFHEMSAPFVSRDHPRRKGTTERQELDDTFAMIQWRNNYLHRLLHPLDPDKSEEEDQRPLSSVRFTPINEARNKFHFNIHVLHHHSIFTFIHRIKNHYPKELSDHRAELGIRLLRAHYQRSHETHHPTENRLPAYLRGEIFDQRRWKMSKNDIPVLFFEQYMLGLKSLFEGAAHPEQQIEAQSDRLLAHNDTVETLEKGAWDTYRVLSNLSKYPSQERKIALRSFKDLLHHISFLLEAAVESDQSKFGNPVHLLHFSAIYIRRLNCLGLHAGLTIDPQALTELRRAMAVIRRHKSQIINHKAGSSLNSSVQNWLSGTDRFGSVPRFSLEWWSFLEGQHDTHTKDSQPTRVSRPRHRPTPSTQFSLPVPPRYPPPKGPWRFPTGTSASLRPPGRIAGAESVNSVYSDDSFGSTHVDSPLMSGYNTGISSPLDEKSPSFEGSSTILEGVATLKSDFRDASFDGQSFFNFPKAHLPRRLFSQSEMPIPIARRTPDFSSPGETNNNESSPSTKTGVTGEELSAPNATLQFPVPVHYSNTVISDNPYERPTHTTERPDD